MKESPEDPKIGAGHAAAMARLGLRELRGAFYPESNVAQTEYGLYGTRTPGEVADARSAAAERDMEDENPSVLADRLQQADVRAEHGRDSKSLDRE